MGLTNTLSGFWGRLTGGSKVPVVDAMHTNPTQASIPRTWSSFLGPGQPMGGVLTSAREQDAQQEPRSFQYTPNVNATISPRAAYGLMPFTDLRAYAETVPEVSMCIRILTEELKAFTPKILDKNGAECKDPALKWMTTTPDLFNPWPVWLSRFLYNVLVYDAGAVHRPRDSKNAVMSLRVIDGSTLFVIVDESGEQPAPPAPAFTQIIYGVPRGYFNSYAIWYRPRHLRADAPYGRSPIEDCIPAVKVLANLWDTQEKWFSEGTIPEQVLTAPEGWTTSQILEFENGYNTRMAGNTEERAGRIRFMPAGTQSLSLKDATFHQDIYDAAANTVRMTYGIPRTEFGESPGTGLGGSGFLEAMQSVFYRMGLAPLKAYIESLFNETLEDNGYAGYTFDLAFPQDSLDPQKEETKALARFTQGLTTRDETREVLNLQPLGGQEGEFIITPGGAGGQPGQPGQPGQGEPNMIPVSQGSGHMIPVANGVPVTRMIPVGQGGPDGRMIPVTNPVPVVKPVPVQKRAEPEPETGVEPDDDAYFGADLHKDQAGEFTVGGTGQRERLAKFFTHRPGTAEAICLLDRALAPNPHRHLVPVTYSATDPDGQDGMVVLYPMAKAAPDVDRFAPAWIEQAAVLDYVAGCNRAPGEIMTHPTEPRRPILIGGDSSFRDGWDAESPFIKRFGGQPISQETTECLQAIIGDHGLWRDLEDCVGADAAAEARDRAETIRSRGRIPG